jgi:cysteine desulfurase
MVRKAMFKELSGGQANASTPYREGRKAAYLVSRARAELAKILKVEPENLIFTSGATEANNCLRTIAKLLPPDRRTILYNPMEHPSVLEPLKLLSQEGFTLLAAKPDGLGRIGIGHLAELWTEQVSLVVMMAANNETGTFYDLEAIVRLAHERGALVFSDMVQAFGKTEVDLTALEVDYASFSAHKIYGPKGIGVLYLRPGAPFAPLIVGGSQENGLRAGTECLHNLAGLAQACREIPGLLAKIPHLRRRKERFIEEIKAALPTARLNTPPGEESQPGTVSLTLPGFENSHLLGQLDYHGLEVAAGSACRTGANEPSHVLLAIGLSPEEARSTLRVSFGHHLTDRQLKYVIDIFKMILSGRESGDITVVRPGELTEELIFSKNISIIHVKRYPKFKGPPPLPTSRTIALGDKAAWEALKPSGPLLLTCEVGYDAPIMAWSLKRRGFKDLSFLATGLWGLKLVQPELWTRLRTEENETGGNTDAS